MTGQFPTMCSLLSLLVLIASAPGHAQWSGEIIAWGGNTYGQCNVPYPNTGFVAVSAGAQHSLGLREDSTIVAWGRNDWGQCDVPSPNTGFVAVSGGLYFSLGLKADGTIVAWGQNNKGQCVVPSPNSGFVAISAGAVHGLGLKEDGSIVAWGSNDEGQCSVPAPNTGFVAIAAGAIHSLGLKEDGSIVAWGRNDEGQCTVPDPNDCFVAVSGGWVHSLGLKENNTSVEDEGMPGSFLQITSVSPNPFSTSTSVVFHSPCLSGVTLEVFDTAGHIMKTRYLGVFPAGSHTATWDGMDCRGREMATGVYLIRLISDSQQASAKVVLVR